jgi:hypothetical protein
MIINILESYLFREVAVRKEEFSMAFLFAFSQMDAFFSLSFFL